MPGREPDTLLRNYVELIVLQGGSGIEMWYGMTSLLLYALGLLIVQHKRQISV